MKKNKEINIQVYQIITKIWKFIVNSFKIQYLKPQKIIRIETVYSLLKLMMKGKIHFLQHSHFKIDLLILVRINKNNLRKVNFSISDWIFNNLGNLKIMGLQVIELWILKSKMNLLIKFEKNKNYDYNRKKTYPSVILFHKIKCVRI